LFAELGLAGHLERARAVGFHHLRLQVRAGAQVARVQVHEATGGLGLGHGLLLALLLVGVLLQARHFLPLSHLEHLVLRGTHLR
jgi:hypothetical protein